VLGYFIQFGVISKLMETDANVINLAGRQRMLSQGLTR